MIFSVVENFVLFGAIFALISFVGAWLIRLIFRENSIELSPQTLTRVYSTLILFPPIFAIWVVLAALLPMSFWGAEVFYAEHSAPVHDRHLISDLTSSLEPFLSYSTVSFLVFVSSFICWKTARGYFRLASVINVLEIDSHAPSPAKIRAVRKLAARHDLRLGLISSPQPLTFIWGFFGSKLIVSSGLLNLLEISELGGVIEHEAAHKIRRDNLSKLVLTLASYLTPAFPLTRRILRWRSDEVELICDETAAVATRRPLDVASAIIKVGSEGKSVKIPAAMATGFMGTENQMIEQRVSRLVDLSEKLPVSVRGTKRQQPGPAFQGISFLAFFFGSLALLALNAPHFVHQVTETLIGLFRF